MEKKRKTTRRVVALFLMVVCVTLMFYAWGGVIYAAINNFKLIPTSERFTELYFTNPAAIPTSTTPGQPIAFIFTIHNLEGATTTYPYDVYLIDSSGTTTVFASDTITLGDGASSTIAVSYLLAKSQTQGQVVVDLPSQNNQQIDFFLPYTNLNQ